MSMQPKLHATIAGGPEGLTIVIPARRHLFVIAFLGLWLVGWFLGEVNAIAQFFSGRLTGPEAALLLWLVLWTVCGSFALYVWLWMLIGKERILLGSSTLLANLDLLGLGRTRTYALARIRNLRVAPVPIGPRENTIALRLAGLAGGMIAFDYEGKAIRLGASVDAAEAQLIVERMKQRHAFAEGPILR
jgi:hypothetical protein